MKRILSAVLCFIMVFTISSTSFAETETLTKSKSVTSVFTKHYQTDIGDIEEGKYVVEGTPYEYKITREFNGNAELELLNLKTNTLDFVTYNGESGDLILNNETLIGNVRRIKVVDINEDMVLKQVRPLLNFDYSWMEHFIVEGFAQLPIADLGYAIALLAVVMGCPIGAATGIVLAWAAHAIDPEKTYWRNYVWRYYDVVIQVDGTIHMPKM